MAETSPVVAAGVGVRRGWGWVLRAVSLRIDGRAGALAPLGIAATSPAAGTAVVSLLAGLTCPAHGELRVLGEDLTTSAGRAAIRDRVGVSHRPGWALPHRIRIRGLVERAARATGLPAGDRETLTAAILDRLGLTPWAQVSLWSAPATVGRRARLAAAAVHQPDLLLLDGILDNLRRAEAQALARGIRDVGRDTAIVVTGCDAAALALACDEVLTIADGVLLAA